MSHVCGGIEYRKSMRGPQASTGCCLNTPGEGSCCGLPQADHSTTGSVLLSRLVENTLPAKCRPIASVAYCPDHIQLWSYQHRVGIHVPSDLPASVGETEGGGHRGLQ